MVGYTVILLNDWSKHGNDIKKMFHDNELEMDSTKIKKLTNEELTNEYKKFMVNSYIKITKSIIGTSGIFLSKDKNVDKSLDIAIKIIKTEFIDELGETILNDNVLIIYKGVEEKFYIEFLKKIKNISSLVIKILDNEIIFKHSSNIKLIKELNDIQGEKNIKIQNFIEKSNIVGVFSDDMKNKWINCIEILKLYNIDTYDEK